MDSPLITPRSALIVLLALLTAGAAGLTSYLSNRDPFSALLVAGTAAAGATLFFQKIIAEK
ncbi:hypothetical protein [Phytomonospora endophytica]|uniref:Uncharacterized protein n=1 Tax=Phytomonospora endophytica TaxID=714109 RepID=A0A841FMS3_9ACTN|nr:hypothetical protein [Phytomonospora endophytica]MBB6033909.1 hypothetical protein [Phytomonospora endophytica]GIG64570.1 hypothetical protein Pen01_08650 [Phytomonospora endophytica]